MTGPIELNVYQTSDCNAACKVCLRQHPEGIEYAPDVTPEVLQRTLEVFPSVRSATVAGFGEPLLSPAVADCCRWLKGRGLYVGIITNGIALPGREDEVASWDVDQISVSLNASAAREWSSYGTGAANQWKGILRAVRKLVGTGRRVVVSFIAHRGNYERIPLWLDLARKLEADAATIVNLLPTAGLAAGTSRWFWGHVITDDDDWIVERVEANRGHPFAEKVTAWPVPLNLQYARSCKSPWRSVGVDGRGALSVCRRVYPPSENYATIWQPDPWEALRFKTLRRAMEADFGSLPDGCKMCFGRSLDA